MMGSKTWAVGCCMVGMFTALAGGAEITLVPASANGEHTIDGNEIILDGGGQRIFLEIHVSGWDPSLLKAWQATIDSSGYSSGLRGTLTPELEPCIDNRECRVAYGGICSLLGDSCTDEGETGIDDDCQFPEFGELCTGSSCTFPEPVGGFCKPGFIFTSRPDYVFSSTDDLAAVDVSALNYRFGSLKQEASVIDPGVPQYAATLVLSVPLDAMGTFTVGFDDAVDSTSLADDDGLFISPLTLTPALITIKCQTTDDCDDGNACTDDVCEPAGTCSNENNFDDIQLCCNPADRTLTAIDDGNECTEGVCNPADGSVTQSPLAEDTVCGNQAAGACDAQNTCDGAGTCVDRSQPIGTACGDPSDTDCDNPDTCDGAGACRVNLEPAATACGDPSDTDCDNPDSCDGAGACVANN